MMQIEYDSCNLRFNKCTQRAARTDRCQLASALIRYSDIAANPSHLGRNLSMRHVGTEIFRYMRTFHPYSILTQRSTSI